ncbi:hypothetical protein [Flavobacterium sp. UBA7663]|uniref:hypothetical protein n=1 Tax=Flavobacterium sp. UBA7663 TaxID=1946557 RepID=UPI0025C36CEC|nr:hypothetical protein [Flavobacterium sp. UBA7663]
MRKIVGNSDFLMDGILIPPNDSFEENLTAESLLTELNTRNCFDFDYFPNEEDNLVINEDNKNRRGFISFVFRKGKWQIGDHSSFSFKLEEFNFGKVSFE